MKLLMHKIYKWLLVLMLLIQSVPNYSSLHVHAEEEHDHEHEGTQQVVEIDEKDYLDDGVFRLLLIGNSFSQDASNSGQTQLLDILKAMLPEGTKIEIGHYTSGGKTVAWYASRARNDEAFCSLSMITSDTGKWKGVLGKSTISTVLEYKDWDVVTIQPHGTETTKGAFDNSNTEEYHADLDMLDLSVSMPYMLDYIHEYAPQSDVYYYLSWATSSAAKYDTNGSVYNTMLDNVRKVQNYSGENKSISGVIPVGTAVQTARTSYLAYLQYNTDKGTSLAEDKNIGLTRDGWHVSYNIGRYIAALTFAETLIPESMRKDSYTLPSISDSQAIGKLPDEYTEIAQLCVNKAIESINYGADKQYAYTKLTEYQTDPAVTAAETVSKTEFVLNRIKTEEDLISALTDEIKDLIHDEIEINIELKNEFDPSADTFDAEVSLRFGYTTKTVEVSGTVKGELEGKKLSVLGASISTFAGTSNGDASKITNSTIKNNAKYYPNTTIPEITLNDTWWMQVCEDLNLELLVNNSWSGSAILLERSGTVGAYVDRCVQLHDNTGDNAGEEPDIIIIQMGFNDFSYGKATLGDANINYEELITANGYGEPKTTMEATVIMLDKMTKRYPDAEIYMFNHFKRVNQSSSETTLMETLNNSIKTVCDKYGVNVVDLYSTLTSDDYIGDGRVHPNKLGMDVITETVKKTLVSETGYELETHTVEVELKNVNSDYWNQKIVVDGDQFELNLSALNKDDLSVQVMMGNQDVTSQVYQNGCVSIEHVTDNVSIVAEAVHQPQHYRWTLTETELSSEENPLTLLSGTIENKQFTNVAYELDTSVVLNHDELWTIEWKSSGSMNNEGSSTGARIFTSTEINSEYNARYIFKSSVNGLITMGEKRTDGSHNYGLELADYGIDGSAEHVYKLENRIHQDGSNMIYLSVDGKEVGALDHYYIGTKDQNTESDWLSGKDFMFSYMGTDTHGFSNCSIEYIEVWENGKPAEQMTIRYDDHLDMTGKTVQIIDAGTTGNVVSLENNMLVATSIGTALVSVDGTKYEITVKKAQVNLVVIMGQSNAGNHFDNATSEVTSPLGTAYWWGNGKGTSATEPVDYTQASKGFHTPLIAELYAQSVESGNPVKPVMIWQEGITSKNGKSITSWATSASNASGTKDTATMITNCLNYYEQNSDKYEVVSTGVYWLQGESDVNMNPVLYTERFMAMWNTLKTAGADYLAFLRVRKGVSLQGAEHEDLGHHAALSAQIAMANQYVDMFMATDLTENWTGTTQKTHSVDLRNYITLMQLYGADGQYTDTYGNNATVSNGILTTTMKTLYGSNNQCHYGKFGYGLIGADAAYNMISSLSTLSWSIVQTDTSGKAERKVISEAGDENVINITEMSDHLSFRASCGSAAGVLSIKVTSDGKDITNSEGIIIKEGSYYGAVNVEELKKYADVSITVTYTPLNGKSGSVDYRIEHNVLSLRYDDHLDMTGKTVQIINAGTPTSYQVGTSTLDNAVVTLVDNTLIATGVGSAFVSVDDVVYEITVEAAPISLFMITGHSIGAGQQGSKDQSVVCEAGQVYSSHGTKNLASSTSGVGISYAALNKANNVNAFTDAGSGTIGEGSALGYQYNQLTNEKVWILNTAVGGSNLKEWLPGTANYTNAAAQFKRAQAILSNEISAGHYTLSHMGILYHNGANFSYKGVEYTQDDLKSWYDAMWSGFKQDLLNDVDRNGQKETVSFLGLVPIWTKSAGASYTQDEPAGLYMAASKEYDDIFTASLIGKDWLTNSSVNASFPEINYTTQDGVELTRPVKTSEVFASDNVHYLQAGYNALGMDIAEHLNEYLNETEEIKEVQLVYPATLSEIEDEIELSYNEPFIIAPLCDPMTTSELEFTVEGCIELSYPLTITAVKNGTGKLTVSMDGKVIEEKIFVCNNAIELPSDEETYSAFVSYMSKKASLLGMGNTSLSGVIGENYTSAEDMMKLMLHARNVPLLANAWGKSSYKLSVEGENARSQTVQATYFKYDLDDYYQILGAKTGTKGNVRNLAVFLEIPDSDDQLLVIAMVADGTDGKVNDRYKTARSIADAVLSGETENFDATCKAAVAARVTKEGNAEIQYHKNKDESFVMASLVKVMVAVCTADLIGDTQDSVTYKQSDIDRIGSLYGNDFKVGDTLSLEEAFHALILPSSNVTASMLGRSAGIEMMKDCDTAGHHYGFIITPPTCTEAGYTTYTCVRCEETYKDNSVDALGHDYESVITAPTCTEQGYTTHTCSGCGDTKLEVQDIDLTDLFKWTDGQMIQATTGVQIADGNWMASDYIDVSMLDSIELVTADTVTASSTIGLAFYDVNKTYISGVRHTDGTGTEYGILAHELEIPENAVYLRTTWYSKNHAHYDESFGEFYAKTVSEFVPATGHDYQITEKIDPTCSNTGKITYICVKCSDTFTETLKATNIHNYNAGTCVDCQLSVLGNDWLIPEFAEGDYAFVVLPDTQNLVSYHEDAYLDMMKWIVDHEQTLNIKAVLNMGDMVNSNTTKEWTLNKKGNDLLNDTNIAWMPMRGNHDDSTGFNNTYDYEAYGSNRTWFGGSYDANKLDHTYWFVNTGEREYLILSLGWAPSWGVLEWAQKIVENHSDKNVILTCHGYMNSDGTLLSKGDAHCVSSYHAGYPDGDDVWAAFKPYDNVVLAMGGHIHSADLVTYVDKNGTGNDVTSLLIDRQNDDMSNPVGMIALFTFNSENNEVEINWYSSYYDALYREKNQFTIDVPHIGEHICEYKAVVTAPTCEDAGYTTYTCTRGDHSYVSDHVEALGHEEVTDEAVDATCTETGLTEGKQCERCGEVLVEQTVTDKLGHNYTSVVVDPTCTEQGYTTYTCVRCDDSYVDDYTNALGHNYGIVVTAPNCISKGYTTYTCVQCSHSYQDHFVDSTGEHDYVSGTCTGCGHSVLGNDWIAPEFVDGDYSMVVVPDPQRLVNYHPEAYYDMMQWIVDNEKTLNIQAVLNMGDMTDTGAAEQWVVSKKGMDLLNSTDIAWMPMMGNHDDSAGFNSTYDYATYGSGRSWFGGSYQSGKLDHTYWFVDAGDRDYLIFSLGWMPTVSVLSWAEGILQQHPDKNVIVTVHAYMNSNGALLSKADFGIAGLFPQIPDGQQIWDTFKKYENVVLMMSGHVHSEDIVSYVDQNAANKDVASLLLDRQNDDTEQKLGTLAIFTFHEDSDTVEVNWYSTKYDAFYREKNQLTITVPHTHKCEYETETFEATCTEGAGTIYTCTLCGKSHVEYESEALGHKEVIDAAVDATCTETGLTEGKHCERCDEVLVEQTLIDQLGHQYESVVTDPTCTTGGYTTHTCERCDDTYTDAETDKLGHEYTSVVTEATCEEAGYTTYTCTRGDDSYVSDHVDALGHAEVLDAAEDATCTETGLTEGKHCGRCGEVLVEQKVTDKLGHDYAEVVVDPTCTESGYTKHICTRCDDVYEDAYVTELGHHFGEWFVSVESTYETAGEERRDCERCDAFETRELPVKQHSYTSVVVDPTCTEAGYTLYTCTECGNSYQDNAVKALGHSYGSWTIVVDATHDAKGTERRDCVRCDEFETREIAVKEHVYSSTVIAPTCTTEGYTVHTCECGDSYKDTYVSTLSHNFGEFSDVVEADCFNGGTKVHVCETCGFEELVQVEPLGHKLNAEVTAPSCTEAGYTTYTCQRCGYSYTDDATEPAGHDFGEWIVVIEADCVTRGMEMSDCQVCEHYETRYSDALGHDYESVVTAPDCRNEGYTTHTCTRCSDSYVDSYVESSDHGYGQWLTVTEATCTTEGLEKRICTGCGREETRTIEINDNHKEVVDEAVDASCTESGLTEGSHCERCGEVLVEQTAIDKLGHDYESVVTEATCTEKGYTTHTCTRCSDSYVDEYTDKAEHDYGLWFVEVEPTLTTQGVERRDCENCEHFERRILPATQHEYTAEVIAPTCTDVGYTVYTCTKCNDTYRDHIVDALGHELDQWVVIEEGECTKTGIERRDCVRCDHYEIRSTEAPGHDNKETVIEPTCTQMGYTIYECQNCKAKYEGDYVEALGHTFGEWYILGNSTCGEKGAERRDCEICDGFETREAAVLEHTYEEVVVDATCTEAGKIIYTCSRCNDTYTEQQSEPAGHSFGEWKVKSEATCTQDGTEIRICEICDETEERTLKAKGHKYVDKGTAATCTENGVKKEVCERCSDAKEEVTVQKLGHSLAKKTATATCTQGGYELTYCQRCDYSKKTNETSALGHSFGPYVSDNNATADKDGTKTSKCTTCGSKDTVIEPGTMKVISNYMLNLDDDALTVEMNGSIDRSKLHLIVNYTDGTSEEITDYELSDLDASAAGKQDVSITYRDYSDVLEINVIEADDAEDTPESPSDNSSSDTGEPPVWAAIPLLGGLLGIVLLVAKKLFLKK